ncbi:MAG: hypothetical protein AAGH64_07725, partial [Planctomycetota bacterium]
MPITQSLKATLVAATVALASCGFATSASAETTKITLNDGTVLQGEVVREGGQFIILVVKVGEVEKQEFIRKSDISEIVRDAPDASADDSASGAGAVADSGPVVMRGEREEKAIPENASKIAFVSLEEMVGPYFNTDALKRSMAILDDLPENERPDIVVLRVKSGGGALMELERIVPFIRDEIETKYRTVAWIEDAISAAAMTAWVVDEMYMMRKAAIGGCTGYRMLPGGAEAMEGPELEQVLMLMERVSIEGNKPYEVMRAMQIYATLSADIDENGKVTWHLNDSGEYMISPDNEVLTMNSYEAQKFGISKGTVDTKDELARALGCVEWVEVGAEADELMVEFRENVKAAELEMMVLYQEMSIALDAMNATPELRNKKRHFGRAENKYKN